MGGRDAEGRVCGPQVLKVMVILYTFDILYLGWWGFAKRMADTTYFLILHQSTSSRSSSNNPASTSSVLKASSPRGYFRTQRGVRKTLSMDSKVQPRSRQSAGTRMSPDWMKLFNESNSSWDAGYWQVALCHARSVQCWWPTPAKCQTDLDAIGSTNRWS